MHAVVSSARLTVLLACIDISLFLLNHCLLSHCYLSLYIQVMEVAPSSAQSYWFSLKSSVSASVRNCTSLPCLQTHICAEGANLLDAQECEQQVDKLLREFDTNR